MSSDLTRASEKTRILFATTIGMSARALLRGQLSWFKARGWHVTLVSSPDEDAIFSADREDVSFVGVQMERNISVLRDLRSAAAWINTIRKIKPTVVNVGTPKAGLLGIASSWILRVPRRIYTIRGLRLEGASGVLRRILWIMERLTIAMATDVIAISPSLAKEIGRLGLAQPQNVWVIGQGSSNGVDTAAIQNRIAHVNNHELRKALGISPTSFVLGYIGRVTPAKGIATLLRAIEHEKLADHVKLLIIGSIEDPVLYESITENNKKIRVVSWTDDLWGYLPAIDTLCLPTLREGFGNVVIEAAAAGIPSITTRVTGAMDTVVDGETGFLVDLDDAASIVERVNILATDPDLVANMGNKAQERAEKYFKPEMIWQGIEAIAEGRKDDHRVRRLSDILRAIQ